MLYLVLKVHQDGILDELGLQEAFFVDWAVKKALVAQIPEKVCREVLNEEVFRKIGRKVSQLVPKHVHGLFFCMVVDRVPQSAVEEHKKCVVLFQNLIHNTRIFLPECAVLEL